MRKIFTSEVNGFSETGSYIEIYALDSHEEWEELYWLLDEGVDEFGNSAHDVLMERLGYSEYGIVPAGAYYETYDFRVMGDFLAVEATVGYNV